MEFPIQLAEFRAGLLQVNSMSGQIVVVAADPFSRGLDKGDTAFMNSVERPGPDLFRFLWVLRADLAMLGNMQTLHSTGTE